MGTTRRAGRALPSYLDFRDPPPTNVLNKEKHFASSLGRSCNKHTIVTICGFVWVGWGFFFFFLLNGVFAACFFKEVENGNYNHYM